MEPPCSWLLEQTFAGVVHKMLSKFVAHKLAAVVAHKMLCKFAVLNKFVEHKLAASKLAAEVAHKMLCKLMYHKLAAAVAHRMLCKLESHKFAVHRPVHSHMIHMMLDTDTDHIHMKELRSLLLERM